MKLPVRNCALLASITVLTALSTPGFGQRFYLASAGGVNGAAGSEISGTIWTGSDHKVEVQVWFENNSGTAITNYTSAGTMLGYDRSSTAGTSAAAYHHAVLLDGDLGNPGASGAAVTSGSSVFETWLTPFVRGAYDPAAGSNNPNAGAYRPFGLNVSQGSLVSNGTIAPGDKVFLFSVKLWASGMAAGSVFGDSADESGVVIYKHREADNSNHLTFGHSGIDKNDENPFLGGSVKYTVSTPVPEPMTMLALGSGVVALLMRRRRKA